MGFVDSGRHYEAQENNSRCMEAWRHGNGKGGKGTAVDAWMCKGMAMAMGAREEAAEVMGSSVSCIVIT
jgi:hypothetical protein